MKRYLLFLIVFIGGTYASSQEAEKIMQVKDMHKDIDYFYEKLLSIHPYPFLILSQEQWQEKVDSLKNSITQAKTKKDFFLDMSKFNAYLDLHSSIHIPQKAVKKMKGSMVFPTFVQVGDSIFFEKEKQKYLLVNVGDNSTEEIKQIFFERNSLVEPMYRPTFLNMIRRYCTYNMVEDSIKYNYKDEKGRLHTSYFVRKQTNIKPKDKTGTYLQMDTNNSVAVMRVSTFAPANILEFRDSIESYFQQLNKQNIKRLYVDITANSGGLVALTGFLAGFFIDSKEDIYAGTWTAKSSKERDMQKLDFILKSKEEQDQEYIQRKYTFNAQNSKPKYNGEVFVVQSRNSYSAASVFASLIKHYYNKCTIIGEEGEIKAFYADPLMITLPKSKFRVSLSSMFGRFVGKEKSRGVVPDIHYDIYDPTEPISLEELEKITANK
ncbi:MAG: S41 family peptidase [Bacteroidota bacterium]|nr:S41 family peptidase [Bacteroidota bacterium]